MDCRISRKTKIIPPDEFKNFVYSYFGGPLFLLFGFPLKSDKKTPMKGAGLVHFACTCKIRPESCETLHDYARYQMNLVRCSNGECMVFDKPVDFHSGIYSKYWKFIRGSDPESKLGKDIRLL